MKWWRRIHKPLVIAFALCVAGLGYAGFALQPASGPPPILAETNQPNWDVDINPSPTGALTVGVALFVCGPIPVGGPEIVQPSCNNAANGVTRMQFELSSEYADQVNTVDVLAYFRNISPGLCPADTSYRDSSCSFTAHVPLRHHVLIYQITMTFPAGIFYARAGSYANAALPAVSVIAPDATIYQQMVLQGSISPSQISVLEGPSPMSNSAYAWSWEAALGSVHQIASGRSVHQVAFTLTDIAGVESDSKKAFLSGILLGVAGGALVALIEQLLRPLGPSDEDSSATAEGTVDPEASGTV